MSCSPALLRRAARACLLLLTLSPLAGAQTADSAASSAAGPAAASPASSAPAPAPAPAEGYSITISPVLPVTEMKRRWQPLLDYLSQASGLKLHFVFQAGGAEFLQAIAAGQPDFAVLGPLQQERARARYRAIVRDAEPLQGLVIVRADGPVRTPADLQGRVIGLPASLAPAAAPFLRQQLAALGVSAQFEPVSSQANAYRSVLLGKLDAIASDSVNYRLQPPELVQQLRAVFTAAPLAPMAVVARRDLPEADVRAFRDALLRLRDPALLALLPFTGLRAAEPD